MKFILVLLNFPSKLCILAAFQMPYSLMVIAIISTNSSISIANIESPLVFNREGPIAWMHRRRSSYLLDGGITKPRRYLITKFLLQVSPIHDVFPEFQSLFIPCNAPLDLISLHRSIYTRSALSPYFIIKRVYIPPSV